MMTRIILTFFLILTSAAHSAEVSLLEFGDPELRVCYRWMGKREARRWMRGQITFGSIMGDGLGRSGRNPRGIFCWHNPQGGAAGGLADSWMGEVYGSYLLRIELNNNAVLYNRNRNTYHSNGSQIIPTIASGVDSPVMYANYSAEGLFWFQEIIIKDSSAIKSWSLNSPELREEFFSGVDKYVNKKMNWTEMHFFINYCNGSFEPNDERAYYCDRYENILLGNKKFLEAAWNSGMIPEKTFDNL